MILLKIGHLMKRMKEYVNTYYVKSYFKVKGAKIGTNCRIYGHLYLSISSTARLSIGDDFLLTSGESYNPLCRNIRGCISINDRANLTIGNNVGISSACIWVHKSITIGNNVKIGGDCILLDSDCHSLNYVERRISEIDVVHKNDKEIVIGDDVLIGTRCIILKGVHIGERSIIGSGSIVTKDIPSDCIAAGNPCKVIRKIS